MSNDLDLGGNVLYKECRQEGFRDSRDGVYRPEAYASGVAKNGYRRGKDDWVDLMAKEQT